MSFQKKYWYTFKDLKDVEFKVEIWQDTTGTLTAQEIRGDANPFIIQYLDVNKFDVIRGSGCELNLLSETDRQFFGLYTADMLEFQIRVYKGVNLIWIGYLDSELYSEPFNEIKNYPVRFSGTDGFALLERMNYLDINGNKYTGLDTQFNVIKNILSKLGMSWNNIFISVSTTSTNFVITSGETIFHKTYCNNQNWYNEDGDAETCRDVLEHILKPYGCFIIQDNASLFITDINTLAKNTTTTFKKYDSSFNFVEIVNLNLNLGDISTIKFAESNQQLNVVSGFNKQIIKYSPYISPELIDFTNTDFSDQITSVTYGTSPNRWTERTYLYSTTWNRTFGTFADYVGADTANKDEGDSYLKIGMVQNQKSFTYSKELPYFIPSGSKIKIKAKGFVRTINDLFNEDSEPTKLIYQLKIRTKLKIGNYYYYRLNSWEKGWTTTDSFLDFNFEVQQIKVKSGSYLTEFAPIDNTWVNLKQIGDNGRTDSKLEIKTFDYSIPLSGFTGGLMTFEIWDWDILAAYNAQQAQNHDSVYNSVKDVRLKDFELIIVDANDNEIKNEDVEYIGFMNSKFKNEGEQITIYQGTSKINNSIEKGAMMYYNGSSYKFISSWTREGKTDCIENLLLRSIESNYTNKTIELTATINKIDSILGTLTYQNFLPDKVFMVVGCEQNLSENTSSIRLQEISIDNLDINKLY